MRLPLILGNIARGNVRQIKKRIHDRIHQGYTLFDMDDDRP